jgi:hypothetical protein
MSVAIRLHEDSHDEVREILVDDNTLKMIATEGAESAWTLPVKVWTRHGNVKLVVTVTAHKATGLPV